MLIWDVTTTFLAEDGNKEIVILSTVVDEGHDQAEALAWTYGRINAHLNGWTITDIYVSGGNPA